MYVIIEKHIISDKYRKKHYVLSSFHNQQIKIQYNPKYKKERCVKIKWTLPFKELRVETVNTVEAVAIVDDRCPVHWSVGKWRRDVVDRGSWNVWMGYYEVTLAHRYVHYQ